MSSMPGGNSRLLLVVWYPRNPRQYQRLSSGVALLGLQALYAALAALQHNAHVRRAARAVLARNQNATLAAAVAGWRARAAGVRGARLMLQRCLGATLQRVFDAWWCAHLPEDTHEPCMYVRVHPS